MEYFHDVAQLRDSLQGIIKIKPSGKIDFIVPHMFRGQLIDRLVFTAVFGSSELLRNLAVSIIRAAADLHGIRCSSVAAVYIKMRSSRTRDFCTPVFNIRGMTYSTARAIFRSASKHHATLFIFGLSPDEMRFTEQSPEDYSSCILGAALRENYTGPIFLQIDNFAFHDDPLEGVIHNQSAYELICRAYRTGFLHFNINGAGHASRSPSAENPIEANVNYTVLRLKDISSATNRQQSISIGLTLGPLSSRDKLFCKGIDLFFKKLFAADIPDKIRQHLLTVSIVPDGISTNITSDGKVENTSINYSYLNQARQAIGKNITIIGLVLNSCSFITPDDLKKAMESGVAEIHFGTRFQNIFFDHPSFPSGLREELHSFLETEYGTSRSPDWSDEQFYYHTRIKSWGHFKKQFWSIDEHTKSEILTDFDQEISSIFENLNIYNSRKLTDKYCSTSNFNMSLENEIQLTSNRED